MFLYLRIFLAGKETQIRNTAYYVRLMQDPRMAQQTPGITPKILCDKRIL